MERVALCRRCLVPLVPVNQAPSRCRLWTLTIRAMCWVWSFLTSGDYVHGGRLRRTIARSARLPERRARPYRCEINGVPALPMPEYYNVLKPVAANAAFAMQGYRSHADTYMCWTNCKTSPADIGRRHILP